MHCHLLRVCYKGKPILQNKQGGQTVFSCVCSCSRWLCRFWGATVGLQLGTQNYNLHVHRQQERSNPRHLRLPIVPEVSLANGRANSATRARVPGTNSTIVGGADRGGVLQHISRVSPSLSLLSHFVDRAVHRSLGDQGCQTSPCSNHLHPLPHFHTPTKQKNVRFKLQSTSNIYLWMCGELIVAGFKCKIYDVIDIRRKTLIVFLSSCTPWTLKMGPDRLYRNVGNKFDVSRSANSQKTQILTKHNNANYSHVRSCVFPHKWTQHAFANFPFRIRPAVQFSHFIMVMVVTGTTLRPLTDSTLTLTTSMFFFHVLGFETWYCM